MNENDKEMNIYGKMRVAQSKSNHDEEKSDHTWEMSWFRRIQEERNERNEVCMLKQGQWSSWLVMIEF